MPVNDDDDDDNDDSSKQLKLQLIILRPLKRIK